VVSRYLPGRKDGSHETVKIAIFPVDIRTRYPQIASLQHYRETNVLEDVIKRTANQFVNLKGLNNLEGLEADVRMILKWV
jgi:hypothetical protein